MSASTTKILVLLLFTGSLVSATGLFWTKKQEAASDPVGRQAEEDKPEKQGLFSRFRNFFGKPKNKKNPEKREEVISDDYNHNPEEKYEIQTIKISNKRKDVRYKEAVNIVNEEKRYKIDLARGNKDRQKKTFTNENIHKKEVFNDLKNKKSKEQNPMISDGHSHMTDVKRYEVEKIKLAHKRKDARYKTTANVVAEEKQRRESVEKKLEDNTEIEDERKEQIAILEPERVENERIAKIKLKSGAPKMFPFTEKSNIPSNDTVLSRPDVNFPKKLTEINDNKTRNRDNIGRFQDLAEKGIQRQKMWQKYEDLNYSCKNNDRHKYKKDYIDIDD